MSDFGETVMRQVFLRLLFPFIGFIGVLAVVSCSEKEFDPSDPQKSYGIAKEPFDEGHYEEAVKRLGEYKARFPYSKFSAEAELLIADSQFLLDRFQEAAVAYDTFVKLHPKHPKAEYAMYRVAESYWEDSPEAVSREQEFTEKAVNRWQELVQKYPKSEFAEKSQEMIKKGRRRLAESVQLVARFYCKREIWHACAYRYTQLLEKYPEFKDMAEESLDMASKALEHVADAKEKDPASDKNLYHRSMTAQQIREKAANLRRILKG
jgi:outer membrane protein assembly factor BamD